MLHNKYQGHWPFGSGEEDFQRVFTLYGHGGHLRHVTQTPRTIFPPTHGGSTWNLAWIGKAVSEKMFENGGQRTDDDGRTTEPAYTISSHMSQKAQVSKNQSNHHFKWPQFTTNLVFPTAKQHVHSYYTSEAMSLGVKLKTTLRHESAKQWR